MSQTVNVLPGRVEVYSWENHLFISYKSHETHIFLWFPMVTKKCGVVNQVTSRVINPSSFFIQVDLRTVPIGYPLVISYSLRTGKWPIYSGFTH